MNMNIQNKAARLGSAVLLLAGLLGMTTMANAGSKPAPSQPAKHPPAAQPAYQPAPSLIPSANATEMLVTDPSTGCKVYIDRGERSGAGIQWKGACNAAKYANGDGTLFWTAGGEVYFIAHFANHGGLIMENGHIRVELPDDAITSNFNSFGSECGGVTVIVRRDVDLAFPPVLDSIVNKVMKQFVSTCARPWAQEGTPRSITIYYQGNENRGWQYTDLEMSVDNNGAKQFHTTQAIIAEEAEVSEANEQIRNIAAQQRATQDRQRQEQTQRNLNIKAQAFADKYGATGGWVQWDRLGSNPFSYQDKVLLFNTEFLSMITPTSGIFRYRAVTIVVSGIPNNTFTHQATVMLAGKVLGTTNVKNQLGGEVSVPQVRYLGSMVCQNSDCDGLFVTTIRGN